MALVRHHPAQKVVPSQTELKVEYFYNVNEKIRVFLRVKEYTSFLRRAGARMDNHDQLYDFKDTLCLGCLAPDGIWVRQYHKHSPKDV